MIKKFEVGKWYKWTGLKKRRNGWNPDGEMDGVLDGKPHKCIKVREEYNFYSYANFDVAPRHGSIWNWYDGFESFEEVKMEKQLELDF